MKISPNLYGRMDGSKFWCFPWFPENSLLCVILCYTGSTIRFWHKVKTWLDQCLDKSTKNWCSVASWVVEIYAWSIIWNFFDLTRPQQPPSERVPYISEKLDFWWSIPQKNDKQWLFWCQWWSDHQDQEVFWGNWTLEAVEASELTEATEVNEAGEVLKAWKITTEDFRVFQVLEFNNFRTNITLFWCFEKKYFLTESWKLMLNFSSFLSEAVEAAWGQKKLE